MKKQIAFLGIIVSLFAGGSNSHAALLENFGYKTMQRNGKPALGTRPVIAIMAEQSNEPKFEKPAQFYHDLLFNYSQFPNVANFFRENSQGRFDIAPAGPGVIGPLDIGVVVPLTTEEVNTKVRHQALAALDVRPYDKNNDGKVDESELIVIIIMNGGDGRFGHRRGTTECSFSIVSQKSICGGVLMVGQRVAFATLAHEMTHSLGALDIYGNDEGLHDGLSLMGPTVTGTPHDRVTYHLDVWHKMALGWVEPRMVNMNESDLLFLGNPTVFGSGAPVLLWSESHFPREFFLLEYRSQSSPHLSPGTNYDANVAGNGMIIWHVLHDGLGNLQKEDHLILPVPPKGVSIGQRWTLYSEGMPALDKYGRTPWAAGTTTPELRWRDGSNTRVMLTVHDFKPTDTAIRVDVGHAANLVVDSGFERQGDPKGGGVWQSEGTGHKGMDLNANRAYQDRNNAWIGDAAGWNAFTQILSVPIEAFPVTYIVGARYNMSANNTNGVYLGIRDGVTNRILAENHIAKPTSGWEWNEFAVTVPAGQSLVRVFFGHWGQGQGEWLNVDNVTLRRQ